MAANCTALVTDNKEQYPIPSE